MVKPIAELLVVAAFCVGPCNGFLTSSSSNRLEQTTRVYESLFSRSVYETIESGKIAVVPNFFSKQDIAPLRRDAASLHAAGLFSTDALASYGTRGDFNPSKDRAVLKLNQWKNSALGDWETRQKFAARMSDLRADLSYQLNRPNLNRGDSIYRYGQGSTEISYTRFGPGAYLARHVDEHHDELKGKAGWSKPTRRSLSWLIYLNEDWNADKQGGCLRCYERVGRPSNTVGARPNGDLQIGWLRPSLADSLERPVFMDSQRHGSGNCAMYIDTPDGAGTQYITKNFNAHPTLFVAGGELLTQKLLVDRREWADRFHFIEPPKSVVTDWLNSLHKADDETMLDVEPNGGTLVVFDSVSLPHEVLATVGRERWATSGWFHED
jgi:Rps23 Pro-64 3,4-dihydroxylase Tpa1-like proline 4-hydroxylase